MMDNSTTFLIGESKNEMLYNNFTICIKTGIEITDGAQNVNLLGNGVDSSDTAVLLSGNCTAYFVNSQLVNLRDSGGSAQYFDIVRTAENFTGAAYLFNTATWGTTECTYNLNGSGSLGIIGGLTIRSGNLASVKNGEASFFAYSNNAGASMKVSDTAKKVYVSGNLFTASLINNMKKITQVCGPDVE
jgi:hypothetical protein